MTKRLSDLAEQIRTDASRAEYLNKAITWLETGGATDPETNSVSISVTMGFGRGAPGAYEAESLVGMEIVSGWGMIAATAREKARAELAEINERYQPLLQVAGGSSET